MASNGKKKRFAIVGGIIVIVVIAAVAIIVGGNTKASITVAQALEPSAAGKRVEVTGTVVDNSYSIEGDTLTFSIYDPDAGDGKELVVRYDQGVSATFGNGVSAICSGTIGQDGVLTCSSLVTKCPSKYETTTDALTVAQVIGYGDDIVDKTIKVQGTMVQGSLAAATGTGPRFALCDAGDASNSIDVYFEDALPDDIEAEQVVVLTGAMHADGAFYATVVAKEG